MGKGVRGSDAQRELTQSKSMQAYRKGELERLGHNMRDEMLVAMELPTRHQSMAAGSDVSPRPAHETCGLAGIVCRYSPRALTSIHLVSLRSWRRDVESHCSRLKVNQIQTASTVVSVTCS